MPTTMAPKTTHSRKPVTGNRAYVAAQAPALRALAALQPFGPIQARMAVGPANDHFEAEADRVADQIVRAQDAAVPGRTSPPEISRLPTAGSRSSGLQHLPGNLQRKCAMCEAEEEHLNRKAADSTVDPMADPVPPSVHEVLRHPGQPLDPMTRTDMETRFGHDFSHVRMHTDAKAAESAQAVHALAYTVGRHVVFGPGQYAPGADTGRRLLAHELTHTLQQGHAGPVRQIPSGTVDGGNKPAAGHTAMPGGPGPVPVSARPSAPALQRTCYRRTCDLGSVGGCIGLSSDITDVGTSSETLFLFRVGCDDFITSPTNDEARLEAFARSLPFVASVSIHGFASEEGPAEFNDNLSCLRAHKAKAVMERAGLASNQISRLYKHGATSGIREYRRSVVIQVSTPRAEISTPENCSRLLGDCEFYLCRERRHPCGDNGYYKGYGYKYCRRFSQLASRLSGPGKDWVRKTLLCLQEYIDRNVPIDTPRPRAKRMAFDSHPACYVRGGVCFLGPDEWIEILKTIDPADNDLKQAVITGVSCIGNWAPVGLFPQHGLGAGGGYRGLMERDRQRLRQLMQQPRPEDVR